MTIIKEDVVIVQLKRLIMLTTKSTQWLQCLTLNITFPFILKTNWIHLITNLSCL